MNSLAPLVPVVMIVGIGGFVAFLFWWERQAKAKRREEMSRVAGELGFTFLDAPASWMSEPMGQSRLFSLGHSRTIAGAMTGRVADFDVRLFDFQYVTGGGKNRRVHRQTVAAFRVPAGNVPRFECRPEGFFHKIGKMFGYRDIEFPDHPAFSKFYLLRAEDENSVRRLFNHEALSHLDRDASDWSIEGGGEWMIFYRAGKRLDAGEVAAYFQNTADLFIKFGVG